MRLEEAFPKFAVELGQLLTASRRPELATQLKSLDLVSRCGCCEYSCSTFYVSGECTPLNEEQRTGRGPFWQDAVDVAATQGMVVIGLDRIDRIVTVEVLNRPDVEVELVSAMERMRRAL
jgi:hypothetical protein